MNIVPIIQTPINILIYISFVPSHNFLTGKVSSPQHIWQIWPGDWEHLWMSTSNCWTNNESDVWTRCALCAQVTKRQVWTPSNRPQRLTIQSHRRFQQLQSLLGLWHLIWHRRSSSSSGQTNVASHSSLSWYTTKILEQCKTEESAWYTQMTCVSQPSTLCFSQVEGSIEEALGELTEHYRNNSCCCFLCTSSLNETTHTVRTGG